MDRCGLISWDKYFKISTGSSFSVEDIARLSLITSLQGKERGIQVILFLMPKMLIEILVVEYEGRDHCGLKEGLVILVHILPMFFYIAH